MLRPVVDELLASYGDLRRYLGGRLGCADDAADIAQSSFEKVYAHALNLAAAGDAGRIESPRALLFSAARNLLIDEFRHRQTAQAWRHERRALDTDLAAPSAEQVVLNQQLVERVAAQLALLPPRRRAAFLLFRVYGYTREEVAARLHITEAAVAKHVVRAAIDCARVFAELRDEPASRRVAAPPLAAGVLLP